MILRALCDLVDACIWAATIVAIALLLIGVAT